MNKLYILIAILFLQSISSFCQVTLPRLISDGVVLQRNEEVKIWGWASPSEDVGLSFKGHKYRTTADRNGEWEIQIPAQEAGGPYEMGF